MKSVLVVDDDTDLLEMVSLMLSTYGLKAICITRGAALFDSIRETAPDIVLMDIYLGDADGRQLCHTLKTTESFGHIPVILYSAGHITSASILESRADHFFPKPFSNAQLVEKIKSLA